MNNDSLRRSVEKLSNSIVKSLELTDFDIDRNLLDLPGVSLLIFTSVGCASCRFARAVLPTLALPVEHLCWIDAGDNGGAVQRYGVFHLPALFVIKDGGFHGAVQSRLAVNELVEALRQALSLVPEELP
ncbi:thioredoxin family protein [Pseudomonas gingeri]|uniref:Thioredoxin family protein n=1 Tax=Pseudomonas gingeri TaxID=117681 RepID=A0A7Y8C549_9PSED|nr:thioredoxin family protein [Pseudomonas gingeri]NWA27604.1 thioredoxin family protein [Pseudomonas gingeri]NWC00396.1 thioredoxin family protein [Pseudomonas gingeri]